MVEDSGQLATMPRICPLLSTFVRLTSPDGEVATQSVNVPPVSIQSCQILASASFPNDLHQHALIGMERQVPRM